MEAGTRTCPGALPFQAWITGEAGGVMDIRRCLVRCVGIDRKAGCAQGVQRQGKGRALTLAMLTAEPSPRMRPPPLTCESMSARAWPLQ